MAFQRIITPRSLEEVLGKRAASSALRALARGKDPRIPDFEMLDPGDIILVRNREPAGAGQLIAEVQKVLGFQEYEAQWTHAMVYVGDLHVAESQKNLMMWPGTRVVPLTKYAMSSEMMVCRVAGGRVTLADANGIARWALLDCHVGKRRYDNRRAFSSATLTKPERTNLEKAVICSEFALECLATGGAVMVKEYNDVLNATRFFYPADFVKSETFRKIPLEFLQLKQ